MDKKRRHESRNDSRHERHRSSSRSRRHKSRSRSKERRHQSHDRDHRPQSRHSGGEKRRNRHFSPGNDGRKNQNPAFEWGKPSTTKDEVFGKNDEEQQKPKEKPNFETTGKLAEDTNKYKGVVIKYNEPPEACKPKVRWRLYPFKDDQSLPTLYVHRQSAYLIGKDRRVVDLPVDHPSCSKQHAVLQYRMIPVKLADGRTVRRVKPYIIDLESTNGTFLNNKQIEAKKFYELFEKDVLKFGFSTREYVLLNEDSLKHEGQEEEDEMGGAQETDQSESPEGVKVKIEPESDKE